jgi:hypothetical protein
VSTIIPDLSSRTDVDRCDALRHFILGLDDMQYLLRPEELARRLTALDELDSIIGDLGLEARVACSDPQTIARANALKSQFEAANEKLFMAARSEISLQGSSTAIRGWLLGPAKDRDAQGPQPGLGFDVLDEIVSGILKLRGPSDAGLLQSPEMVPYQPTPARHILDLIAAVNLSEDDILVDLGSGLGHVPLLISILTGSQTLGVELQPAYVASAKESARNLNLSRVQFVATDARIADLSIGTVFYLFSPFTGSILRDVLQRLFSESDGRQIRICSLGPCTRVLQDQEWLKASNRPNSERITVFESQ